MVGALQRAGAWHGAVLTLVTTATAAPLPAWLAALQLRAELLRARDICECHGLSEVSARRGDLVFLIHSSGTIITTAVPVARAGVARRPPLPRDRAELGGRGGGGAAHGPGHRGHQAGAAQDRRQVR